MRFKGGFTKILVAVLVITSVLCACNKTVDIKDCDSFGDFKDGLRWVEKDEKYGYINSAGKVVVPLEYDWAEDFGILAPGLARVKKDKKCGIVNTAGKVVVPPEYGYIEDFCDLGYAIVEKDGKEGCINSSGEVIVPLKYDHVFYFFDGLARVYKNNKKGYVNAFGEEVMPPEYLNTKRVGANIIAGQKEWEGKWILLNTSGEIVSEYDYVEGDDGRSVQIVSKDGKYGFINSAGEVVVPLEYDTIFPFDEGFAAAEKNGKWGFFNADGELVVPLIYDKVRSFFEGKAEVFTVDSKGVYRGVIDTTGNLVWPMELQ